jgi:phosphatidylglycerol:prolipoprotein diacylglycerol transferase
MLALWQGGFVAYGGFVGGLAGSFWFLRRQGQRFLPWADAVAPSVALGVLLTRIGCYLEGCDFGKPLPYEAPALLESLGSFPRWAAADGLGAPAWVQHVNELGLSVSATSSLPVHPTQLYEAAAGALILALLLGSRSRTRFVGQRFFTLVFSYGCARFSIELVRGDLERGSFGPFVGRDLFVLLALLAFALSFALGPSRSFASRRTRLGARVAAALPAASVFVAGLVSGFSRESIQLSTSQWAALFSVLWVGLLWQLEQRRRPVGVVQRAA